MHFYIPISKHCEGEGLGINANLYRLFMVGIAKEHEIITQKLRLKKVKFEGLGDGNALAVRGKKKSKVREY